MFYISSKNPEQNIHPLSRVIHSRTTMTTYVRIVASNSQQTTPSTRDNTADKHRASMTDRNNSQPPRHGVIKRTIGGSLARSWPPPLPRRRRCCVLLPMLLGLSAAAANNRCAVVASDVCRVWRLCVCTPRALAYVNEQPPRHGVIKLAIGGSLACSWPLPRRGRCCVPLLLLLGLSAAAAANNAVIASAVCELCLLCACSRTYGASSREPGERHASCDMLLSLLLQLRLLRLLRVLLRTAAAAATVVCCHGFLKVGLPEAANDHYEIKWVSR